ncbi:MAG: preprotein translocase subunit SecE [Formivibrio sp.]|nr:preprotein translocase subunit SecE [Formivibrio sp.]
MESIDKVKIGLALLLVAAGVTGFYLLPASSDFLRPLSVLAGVLAAAGVLWFTLPGRQFVDYARDSVKEAQKVVWPNKKETWQLTGIVFLFVGILALFMWLVDSGLAYLFYDVVLGRHG